MRTVARLTPADNAAGYTVTYVELPDARPLWPGEEEELRRVLLRVIHEFSVDHGLRPSSVVDSIGAIVARRCYRATLGDAS